MSFWSRLFFRGESKDSQYSSILRRLIASQEGSLKSLVTPDTCMESPTVHAIVSAISRRIAVTPVHVFRKDSSPNGETKEKLPNHPVANLLRRPNSWQSQYEFWQDAASVLVRHGRFHCYKGRGQTGPIRELQPLHPNSVEPELDTNMVPTYRVTNMDGGQRVYSPMQLFNVRGPARDFIKGDSPVTDIQRTIAMEILAERFGTAFFQNGALPLLVFSFMEGSAGFETVEQEKAFIEDFQKAFSGDKAHRGMLLPKGLDKPSPIQIEHDKAQFIESRQYQRTVIAGAFGVPPHLVGDLERGTYNNVEQQDKDFTLNVIMPIVEAFESSMERDLLTPADRNGGIIIRFNLDSTLRADFKSRQEGLWLQRQAGVISANEWREIEGKNPREDEEGNDYLHPGNMVVDGEEPDEQVPDDEPGNQEPE
jgi:HK97 family phage portal protein